MPKHLITTKHYIYPKISRELLEDTMEFSEETKKRIKESEADIKAGRIKTLEEVESRINYLK